MTNESNLRIPPWSDECERGVLGSILLDPQSGMAKCLDSGVNHEDFYERRHQHLYENLVDMHLDRSKPMDAIMIGEWLKDANALDKVGGYDYLIELQASTIVPSHIGHYIDTVLDKKLYRSIIEQASETIDRAYKQESGALEILNESRGDMFSLDRSSGVSGMTNDEACDAVIDRWQNIADGVKYGLEWNVPEIQAEFGSFLSNGNPYFLAAEPGGGKSVCLQNLFTKWSIFQNKPCAIASIEMTHQKFMDRMLSERGDISSWAMNNNMYGSDKAQENIELAKRIKSQITNSPLHINDRHMNTDEVCAWGLALYEKHGIEALGIDYFQLMDPPEHKKLRDLDALKYNCGKLLKFSKDTGVITIALSQITKIPTDRDGNPRKPRQDDLFGGRIIDAHSEGTVIFYRREERDWATIAKNRNGGTSDVEFYFNRSRLRFESVANKPSVT